VAQVRFASKPGCIPAPMQLPLYLDEQGDPTKFLEALQRRINEGYQIASVDVFTDKNGKSYGSIAYNPVKDGMDVRVQNIAVDVASGGDPTQGGNGWETLGTIVGAADLSYETTVNGVNLVANTFKGTSVVTDLGKLGVTLGTYGKLTVEAGSKILTGVGVFIPLADMYFNPNADYLSDGTDAVMAAVAFIPGVGWIVSGTYFIANIVMKGETGKSIGDHLADPAVQEAMSHWIDTPL